MEFNDINKIHACNEIRATFFKIFANESEIKLNRKNFRKLVKEHNKLISAGRLDAYWSINWFLDENCSYAPYPNQCRYSSNLNRIPIKKKESEIYNALKKYLRTIGIK